RRVTTRVGRTRRLPPRSSTLPTYSWLSPPPLGPLRPTSPLICSAPRLARHLRWYSPPPPKGWLPDPCLLLQFLALCRFSPVLGYFSALGQGFLFRFPWFILFVRPVAEFVKVLTARGGREVSFVTGYLGLRFSLRHS